MKTYEIVWKFIKNDWSLRKDVDGEELIEMAKDIITADKSRIGYAEFLRKMNVATEEFREKFSPTPLISFNGVINKEDSALDNIQRVPNRLPKLTVNEHVAKENAALASMALPETSSIAPVKKKKLTKKKK